MTQLTGSTLRFVGSPSSAAAVSITTTTAADVVAPAGVFFEAVPTDFGVADVEAGKIYDPRFHEIHYKWEFDDPGSYAAVENMPNGWNDRNVKYGRSVSHVFRSAGTYTVRCTATRTSTGVSATTTTQVVVADPDTLYSGNRTILVDPLNVGDSTNYPGAQVRTTLSAGLSAAASATENCRVLLKRGETFSGNYAIRFHNAAQTHCLIGAYGAGGRPVIENLVDEATLLWVRNEVPDVTVADIEFRGGYDTSTETGNHPTGIFILGPSAGFRMTIFRCHFTGLGICIYPALDAATTPGAATLIEDCSMTNWQDYGVFGPAGSFLGISGCSIAQSPSAQGGGRPRGLGHIEHGPIRISKIEDAAYLGVLDLFSANSWQSPAAKPNFQPCIRWNSGGHRGGESYLDRIVAEGGWQVVAFGTQDSGTPTNPANTIIDRFLVIGSMTTDHGLVRMDTGGITLRNAILVMPDCRKVDDHLLNGFLVSQPVAGGQGNADEPVAVYNCTFLALPSTAVPIDNTIGAPQDPNVYFSDYRRQNIMVHQPNAGQLADAPVDSTMMAGIAPRSASWQYWGAPTPDTSYATPAGSIWTLRPQAGSAAIDDATTGLVAYDDFYGTVRGPNPSRGAVEPG